MKQIVALVDYDNQRQDEYRGGRGRGRPPNYRDHELLLTNLIDALSKHRDAMSPGFVELRIRLYGGWTTDFDGRASNSGIMVSRAVREFGARKRFKNTRLFIELAHAPLAYPDEHLYGTYRTNRWRGGALSMGQQPTQCHYGHAKCSNVENLLAWARGRCPERGCRVKTDLVFVCDSQKLVDTLLVSDAILAAHRGYDHILAVSGDDDIVPGILTASAFNVDASLVRFGRRNPGPYDRTLRKIGVNVIDYPALGS